jgi:hypothetical protein
MSASNSKFKIGDAVVVATEIGQRNNPRTPEYVRGKSGVIGLVHGVLENPKDHRGLYDPLYTVRFDLSALSSCSDQDSIWVDVHEEWLSPLRLEDRN